MTGCADKEKRNKSNERSKEEGGKEEMPVDASGRGGRQ